MGTLLSVLSKARAISEPGRGYRHGFSLALDVALCCGEAQRANCRLQACIALYLCPVDVPPTLWLNHCCRAWSRSAISDFDPKASPSPSATPLSELPPTLTSSPTITPDCIEGPICRGLLKKPVPARAGGGESAYTNPLL